MRRHILKIESFRIYRKNGIAYSTMFHVPFLSHSQNFVLYLYFHMSNFISIALRQFYSIAIYSLKIFSLSHFLAVQVSSFLLSSCPTFFLAHLHLHLPIPLLSTPFLTSILFSINNNCHFLSPSLVCVGHVASVTRVFTIPRHSRAIFLSLSLTFSHR